MTNRLLTRLAAATMAAIMTLTTPAAMPAMAASQIKAVVNDVAITSNDVTKRMNFMRLRREKGNLAVKARDELVNEVLMRQEIIRTGMSVSTDDVDQAFARFAAGIKLSPDQLSKLLAQAGVGADHFKAYIGVSMSWPRVVSMRYGNTNNYSGEKLVAKLKENGGKKPTSTEFILQQVIFVIPASRRGAITGKRRSEAEASRKNYPGCENARVFAATMHDVAIKDLGRYLLQQLPPDWKDDIAKTEQGQTTKVRVTEKGVEYIAVCKRREVSDDLAAEMVFQEQDLKSAEAANRDVNSQKYLEVLRKKAQIVLK